MEALLAALEATAPEEAAPFVDVTAVFAAEADVPEDEVAAALEALAALAADGVEDEMPFEAAVVDVASVVD